jgi:hypothetical protein
MSTTRVTVYGLTNEFGQICYVGQTRHLEARFRAHLKYGHPFIVAGLAVLAIKTSLNLANRWEQKWIAFFGLENLFNGNKGGGCRLKPKFKSVMRLVRFDEELSARCDAVCAANEQTFSEWVRGLMRAEVGL